MLPLVEPGGERERAAAQRWAAHATTVIGGLSGAFLGVLCAPRWQRRISSDPFSLKPALVIIAVFFVIGAVLGRRVFPRNRSP